MQNETERIAFYFSNPAQCDLAGTTDLCIAAHPDDIELMAYPAIYACREDAARGFVGLVLTDGAGAAAGECLKNLSRAQKAAVRAKEQRRAAELGGYLAVGLLGCSSEEVKAQQRFVVSAVEEVLRCCRPERVYIHNPADKHDTHVAASIAAITALRALPEALRPKRVYGMEVWRSLDWLTDDDKTVFDRYGDPELERSLITVFGSQIAGHKRYDEGVLGRRAANAVFLSGYEKDQAAGACYAMDMTGEIFAGLPVREMIGRRIDRFKEDAIGRIDRLSGEK